MNDDPLQVLSSVRFDWAPTEDEVWLDSRFHVGGLHNHVKQGILDGIADAEDTGSQPIGVVIEGPKGAGKTHMLGWARRQVQLRDGYFFLVSLREGSTFWDDVLRAVLEGLLRPSGDGGTQLDALLRRLCTRAGVATDVTAAICGAAPLTPEAVDAFGSALVQVDERVGRRGQDVARALVLYRSPDVDTYQIGDDFLQSQDGAEPADRKHWRLRQPVASREVVVRQISQLLALTGPTVIAVDQIDTLVASSLAAVRMQAGADAAEGALLVDHVASGLMALREATSRTLTIVACLPASWDLIKHKAVDTVADRFRPELRMDALPNAEVARALVAKRLGALYAKAGFRPPYPTWPVTDAAFEDAPDYTARKLLQRIDDHLRSCVLLGEVRELERLDEEARDPDAHQALTGGGPAPPAGDLAALDRRFAELRAAADVDGAFDAQREDQVVPRLLHAGLLAWAEERGDDERLFAVDPLPGPKPALHATLRRTLVEEIEDERHWSFRAIAHENARAALARLRKARAAAGVPDGADRRHLCILRLVPWSSGAQTQQELAVLRDAGGLDLPFTGDDLRTFAALQTMLQERYPDLGAWLRARQPATRTELFDQVLPKAMAGLPSTSPAPAPTTAQGPARAPARPTQAPVQPAGPTATPAGPGVKPVAAPPTASPTTAAPGEPTPLDDDAITLGRLSGSGQPVHMPLRDLTKHVVMFAGSGSGKTVLLRRLVEEAALRGVSSIVLDPNNDLARLGEGWPEPPAAWSDEDRRLARDYLAGTDVVIWTPGRRGGRPLSFQPLPDFAPVLGDPDELTAAIDAAVGALAPRAAVDGGAPKAQLHRAVLRESLEAFARRGGGSLGAFIDMLADLPDETSQMGDARRIAGSLAETLRAVTINDPLFGGQGQPVDPGVLLTPEPGKRARVSVVNFVGLPEESARQGFVYQLQMALFGWIKRNARPDQAVRGLLVMDEAQTLAPPSPATACTRSTLMLASQARKYGLGLVFATQAATGLHNQISTNAATQVLGRMNAPRQIDAARNLARFKGGDVPEVARLSHGQFYVALEGGSFRKTLTPLCLSHHPPTPLTGEEVVERAGNGGD